MQNYYNHYQSPQTTEHLEIPMAECNHIAHCTDCKFLYGFMTFTLILMGVFCFLFATCLQEVIEYEKKNRVVVYERPSIKIERVWKEWQK